MALVTDEELIDEFSTFDITLDNDDYLDRLKTLCLSYRLDASALVMEWVAFSHTRHHVPLNQESLEQFERDKLARRIPKAEKTPKVKKEPSSVIYDINTLEEEVDGDDLLDAYSTPTAKGSVKRQHTPDNATNKRLTALGRSPSVAPFSPASFSPASATPSKKYSTRTNSGEVVCTHGNTTGVKWQGSGQTTASITHYDAATANAKFKYMFQKLADKAHVLNDMIEDMSGQLQQHFNIEDIAHVALPVQEPVTVIGRILCDSNGKLNAKSLMLEGSRDTSGGRSISLDVSEVKQYSLFPGQIVAADGINSTGNKFVAKNIYQGIPLPLPEKRPVIQELLQVVVAAGPFTTSDSLSFEPLADLIKYLQKHEPDVCILLGPFLDVRNSDIEKCVLDQTFEDFFKSTVKQILRATGKLKTMLVFVPSQRDVHHDSVYPQPPFVYAEKDAENRIQFVGDPCTLVIDGVVFGLTSTDILFHLGAEEISCQAGSSSDRLARLTQHIITQHSYYPLYPPSEEVLIDYDHFDSFAKMPVTPHVLITPSDLRYFIKDVCGCCCVNPGRLAKGQVGGTFARLVIKPGGDNKQKSIVQNIAGQVVRI